VESTGRQSRPRAPPPTNGRDEAAHGLPPLRARARPAESEPPWAVATREGDPGLWRPDLAISTRCMAGGGGRCVGATEDEGEELESAWWRGGSRDVLRCGQAPGDRANPRRGQGGQPPPAPPPMLPSMRRRVAVFAPADPAPWSVSRVARSHLGRRRQKVRERGARERGGRRGRGSWGWLRDKIERPRDGRWEVVAGSGWGQLGAYGDRGRGGPGGAD
jgi:hypothetical protein